MPRPGIPYEDTWISLLKKDFPQYDIIDRTARGSTTTRLVTEGGGGMDLLETYMPDIVILQLGMADCAPRLFDKRSAEFYIVSRILPARIRQRYIEYVKKHRVRNPGVTEVAPEQFRANITNFFTRTRAISAKTIIIPILPATDIMIRKSPHVTINVDRYNAIYHETVLLFPDVTIVDPFRNNVDINTLAVDETHINPEGLRMIYDALKPLL